MELNFELKQEHLPMERAMMLAKMSLAEFPNDPGMSERVAYRIAEALEKYQVLDFRKMMENPLTNNPMSESYEKV